MANRGHDPEQKAQALTIAAATSIGEASRVTGVPVGTIKRWRSETNRSKPSDPNRSNKNLKALQEQAMEQAVTQASEYIADRLKGMADRLYGLADSAIGKVQVAIRDESETKQANDGRRGESHDRDGSAWLRGLVGVMAQSIDKAQLLSGRPTARPEVTERYEYDITQRIVAERPELIDRIFTENQRPGVADRGGSGAPARVGELR